MKRILIYTIPNARKNEIKVISENIIKVKVKSPPIEGRANKELLKVLSKHFKIHRSEITFIKGITTDKKVIEIPD